MGDFEYPVIISRKRYVTEFGGQSELLEKNQIGLHFEALLSRTNLSAGEEVLIDKLGDKHRVNSYSSHPLFARNKYQIEPITDLHDSRLLTMASEGEAILPAETQINAKIGEEIILNAAIDRLPDNWINKIIKQHVQKRNPSKSDF